MPGTVSFVASAPDEKDGLTATGAITIHGDEEDDIYGITEHIPGFGPVYKYIGEMNGVEKRMKIWLETASVPAMRAKIKTWTTLRRAQGTLTWTQKGHTPDPIENVVIESVTIPPQLYLGICGYIEVTFNHAQEETA